MTPQMDARSLTLFRMSMLHGIGPAALRKIAEVPGLEAGDLRRIANLLPRKIGDLLTQTENWKEACDLAERDMERATRFNARILCQGTSDYPTLLGDDPASPYFLYVKGSSEALNDKTVAVIGTRQPTDHGRVAAKRITEFFVQRGWTIVSGLALGCDSIAHQAAVSNGGRTVAVMAHGLQTVAPSQNNKLAEDILASGGALVSAYRFGVEPSPPLFAARDKVQAALARGVIMIQSDLKGGSLHASKHSLMLNRILAVPAPTEPDKAAGSSKIQANLVITSMDRPGIGELLHLSKDGWDMSKIFRITSRDDYPALESSMLRPFSKPGHLFPA